MSCIGTRTLISLRLLRLKLRKVASTALSHAAMPRRPPALCAFHLRGVCRYGTACRFSHGDAQAPREAVLPFHHRHFVEAGPSGAPSSAAGAPANVRVMSYNILADEYAQQHAPELYTTVAAHALDWQRRVALIASEVAHWRPDVVCMQEVDHYQELEAALQVHGYEGMYCQRTGGRLDGLATFWLRDKLQSTASRCVHFAPLGLKDNVTLLVSLHWRVPGGGKNNLPGSSSGSGGSSGRKRERPSEMADTAASSGSVGAAPQHLHFVSDDEDEGTAVQEAVLWEPAAATAAPRARPPGPRGWETEEDKGPAAAPCLVVANIHVLFNPKRGDIKVAQVRTMLREAHSMAAARGGAAPVVVCGDFNSAAGSPLHQYVVRGDLDLSSTERRRVSGQVEVARHSGWNTLRRHFLEALGRVEGSELGAAGQAACEAAALAAAVEGVPRSSSFSEPSPSLRQPRISGQGGAAEGMMAPAASAPAAMEPLPHSASTSSMRSANSSSASRVRPWSLEELRLAVGEGEGAEGDVREPVLPGQQPPCTVRHPLSLDSAYLAVLGQEPLYTTAHDKYVGTVDYIFYTPQAPGPELAAPGRGDARAPLQLRPVRVLQPPPLASLHCGLPCPAWPSDHVSLLADFEVV